MPRPGNFPYNTPELRLQRFVIGVAQGLAPGDAYLEAGYQPKSRRVAVACASRMLARDDVQQRLHQLRRMVQADSLLSIHEKRKFLKKVVMTPVGAVRESDPMCAKMKRTTRVTKLGTVEKVDVQMPDKLRALELDAKLAGELVGGVPVVVQEVSPSHGDAGTQARLANVLAMMMQPQKAHFGGAFSPPPAITSQHEATMDLRQAELTDVSLALARTMARDSNVARMACVTVRPNSTPGSNPCRRT